MANDAFFCSECDFMLYALDIVESLTIDCPNCEGHTTAYKKID